MTIHRRNHELLKPILKSRRLEAVVDIACEGRNIYVAKVSTPERNMEVARAEAISKQSKTIFSMLLTLEGYEPIFTSDAENFHKNL